MCVLSLLHHSDCVHAGLCPDWEDWDSKKNQANAKEAMDAAEKWLDVPQVSKKEYVCVCVCMCEREREIQC